MDYNTDLRKNSSRKWRGENNASITVNSILSVLFGEMVI
jgi:hypothetical protein